MKITDADQEKTMATKISMDQEETMAAEPKTDQEAVPSPTDGSMPAEGFVVMTEELVEQFLQKMQEKGCKAETVRAYQRSLEELYAFLPEDKKITEQILNFWKASLREQGFSDSTVNLRVSSVNGLLRYCGAKKTGMLRTATAHSAERPEPTRGEYLRFLSYVRKYGSEQDYLLVKLFATVDLNLRELSNLTVEACQEGVILLSPMRQILIPPCMQDELLAYIERNHLAEGAVFVTKGGNLLDRSNITHSIRHLAEKSGMDPEKCSPSALHRMYQATRSDIGQRFLPLYLQAYDSLLNTEQTMIAWEDGERN